MKPEIAVLISGRGTNMAAIAERVLADDLEARIALVAADRERIAGLESASRMGIETAVFNYDELGRNRAEAALVNALIERNVAWVVLAGFMRIFSPAFITAFPERIVNIHPSLLPAFPGTGSIKKAFEYGVKVTGVTVHLVDAKVDHGPILAQRAVEVESADTLDSLEEKIHRVEHDLYWRTLRDLFAERFIANGRRRRIDG